MLIERRQFITGSTALVAAPAIVRATSLMPVKAIPILANRYMPGDTIYDIRDGKLWIYDTANRWMSISLS